MNPTMSRKTAKPRKSKTQLPKRAKRKTPEHIARESARLADATARRVSANRSSADYLRGQAAQREREALPPILRAFMDDDAIVVDNFAGGGGASSGVARALRGLGWDKEPDIAINHDPEAIAMHKANHPSTHHYIEDVWKVDPREACGNRPVGLAWFSPTCFPAGTLVFTSKGMRPIEEVRVGDEVLTHKTRWQRVTATTKKKAATVAVRGQGHYGLVTTPDHPFYSKHITKRWPRGKNGQGKRPGVVREMVENPYWLKAEDMEGKLWATPIRFADAAIPLCPTVSFSEDFFYFVGRWLGDGFTNKGDVYICTGSRDFNAMRTIFNAQPLLDQDGKIVKPRVGNANEAAPRLEWGNAGLARWLEDNFGKYADGKSLPPWTLSMQGSWRRALLEGYVDADGNQNGSVTSTTSVSKALSIGIRLLVSSLGYATSLYYVTGKPGEIEDRAFVGRDSFKVDWREKNQKETVFRDTSHMFAYAEEVTKTGRVETVYCLQVEEDESYVADGIVVHNCTHFSKAKGTALDESSVKIRGLCWVAVRWAAEVKPRIICLENVEEFTKFGPLHRDHTDGCDGKNGVGGKCKKACRIHKPIKEREGTLFRAFVTRLKKLGYKVEWRILRACDYGAPTTRRRLFLVARRDGLPIAWPEPSHGPGRAKPYRTAAEVIDWSVPCPSIFERDRPLADKTLARIARGIQKFVLDNPRPFIVPVSYGSKGSDDRSKSVDEPLPTICGNRGGHAVVTPFLARTAHGDVDKSGKRRGQGAHSVEEPIGTLTTSRDHAIAVPYLVHRSNGERPAVVKPDGTVIKGQAPRIYDVEQPLGTIVAQGQKHAVSVAYLMKNNGGNNDKAGCDLVKLRGTSEAHVASSAQSVDEPLPTVTASGTHVAAVAAFLTRYNGESVGQEPDAPIGTLDTTDRCGLVTVTLGGEEYVIVDIGLRMLTPRELYNAQGFADWAFTVQATGCLVDQGNSTTTAGTRRRSASERARAASLSSSSASDTDESSKHAVVSARIDCAAGVLELRSLARSESAANSAGEPCTFPLATEIVGFARRCAPDWEPAAPTTRDGEEAFLENSSPSTSPPSGRRSRTESGDETGPRVSAVTSDIVTNLEVQSGTFTTLRGGRSFPPSDSNLTILFSSVLPVITSFIRSETPDASLFSVMLEVSDSYIIEFDYEGKPLTKTAQIRMVGNSVPPVMAEVIARAQLEVV